MNLDWKNIASYSLLSLTALGMVISTFLLISKKIQTVRIESKVITTTLSYTGIVNPKKETPILSPVQGTIHKVNTQYGQKVKVGTPIFEIVSPELLEKLQDALGNYLREKANVSKLAFQNNGNQELFRLGLISKVNYMDSLNQYEVGQLSYLQAEEKLKKLLKLSGDNIERYRNLSLAQSDDLKKILEDKPLGRIDVLSPAEGILLFPKSKGGSNNGNSDSTSLPFSEGSPVKEGDKIAIIGDVTGLLFTIKIKETDFHNLKSGQRAKITGSAFPNIELEGFLLSIERQASSTSADQGPPSYIAFVLVPHLTAKQQEIIEIGMSVQIDFIKNSPPSVEIPLTAVIEKDNGVFVQVIDKQTKKVKEVAVKTGLTTEDSVQILEGLSKGDEVVISH